MLSELRWSAAHVKTRPPRARKRERWVVQAISCWPCHGAGIRTGLSVVAALNFGEGS
jgi:hypothetical protein